jgi:ribosomal protein S18 acetylase RimI-like enzyme
MVSMKNDISMRPLDDSDRVWLPGFIAQHWGAEFVLAHDERIEPAGLPGFVVEEDGVLAGLITYRIKDTACEVVTIDSLQPNQGIGSALLDAVVETARTAGCKRLWLVTSNDNLNALSFYQKRGLRLVGLRSGVMERYRQFKNIPQLGESGIPIRDELELEMEL